MPLSLKSASFANDSEEKVYWAGEQRGGQKGGNRTWINKPGNEYLGRSA